MHITLTELSGFMAFVALILTLYLNIRTIRLHSKEPENARWNALEKWQDSQEKKCAQCQRHIEKIDRKIRELERFELHIMDLHGQRAEFEQIILSTTRIMLDIIPVSEDDANERQREKVLSDIDNFLISMSARQMTSVHKHMQQRHLDNVHDE